MSENDKVLRKSIRAGMVSVVKMGRAELMTKKQTLHQKVQDHLVHPCRMENLKPDGGTQ